MASATTIAALQTMYKTVYHGRDLTNQSKRKTAAFDMVAKYDDFDGANLTFPFNYNMPVGVSSSFAVAHVGPMTAMSATLAPTARSTCATKSTPTPISLTSRKNMPGKARFRRSYNRPVCACESLRR